MSSGIILCLCAQSCPIFCDSLDCSPPGSSVHGDSSGKNPGVGCHFLLQEIFPTQGLNPCLLHCRQILYLLSHREVHLKNVNNYARFTYNREPLKTSHMYMQTLCKLVSQRTNVISAEAISFIQSPVLPSRGEQAAMLLKKPSYFVS